MLPRPALSGSNDVVDPRRVLLFRSVARSGSLSAAARELGTTQSAVSQQLSQLEREAGGPLLVRTARGTTRVAMEMSMVPSPHHSAMSMLSATHGTARMNQTASGPRNSVIHGMCTR